MQSQFAATFLELRLQVAFQRRRRVQVADKDEHDTVEFVHRIGFMLEPADVHAVRLGNDLHQGAVAHIEGETVEPAGDGVLRVALRTRGERGAAMRAAIRQCVDLAFDPFEEQPLTEDHLTAAFAVGQLATKERRVPVIAQTQFSVQIRLIGFTPLDLLDDLLGVFLVFDDVFCGVGIHRVTSLCSFTRLRCTRRLHRLRRRHSSPG